jgi:SAM-dependent methyltransferase
MAHLEQANFCKYVRRQLPAYFRTTRVLDVGSLDINGTNRYLFRPHLLRRCHYIGLDLGPGPNVDVVTPVHLYEAQDASFDMVISTEAFEHDRYLEHSLRKIVELLRPRGLFVFTCATVGRPEHGTVRTTPTDSPLTQDFYRNVTAKDIRAAIDVDEIFMRYEFSVVESTHDLRFFGIKW